MFRLGLIGAGRMGRTHLRALASSTSVEVVAVAEPVDPARQAVSEQYGIPGYARPEQLIEAGGIDGLLVATPTDTHVDVVDRATAAGIPVLCEKPCGDRPEHARQAQALAAARSVPVQVAYWRRYVPALLHLRARIADGTLGNVLSLTCSQWDAEPPGAAFLARSGGIFVDMGVHEFDQARWLLGGEVESVTAGASTTADDPGGAGDPDAAVVLMTMTGGETVVVSLGRHYPGGDMVRVELFATEGHALDEFLTPADGESVFLAALERQAVAFAGYARGGPCSGATLEDAVRTLEVAAEAQRQAARERPGEGGATAGPAGTEPGP
jgi:myo-inositol 2-dehydrogenase / D-chiro-inositol 1-dehydrogenase